MKHKETKATSIPSEVKIKVFRRDRGRCIICGAQGLPEAYYIRRSQGGLGIEQNIVTLCRECHREFDEGKKHSEYKEFIKEYLSGFYPDFSDYERVYHKYKKPAEIVDFKP